MNEEQNQKQHEDQQYNRAINLYLDDEEQYTNTTQDQDLDQDLDLDQDQDQEQEQEQDQDHRAIDHSEMATLSSSSTLEEKEINNNNSDHENQEEMRRNVNRYNNNHHQQQQQQQQQQQPHRVVDSYIDIVVLEVPKYCSTTHPCDLSKYGVGQMQHLDQNPAMEFLSLCDATTGRLRIDKEKFRGYRTQLYIPRKYE